MSKVQFRMALPIRTYSRTHARYQAYKVPLASDFYNRCGYTDCSDKWFGGMGTFHIDHFSPIKHFPHLKTTYSNLVYSCSYVNILKSDDHPNNYLDPCNDDYNEHFYRDKLGVIYPADDSPKAKYMHKKLKLGLARYSTIWLIDKIYNLKSELNTYILTLPEDTPEHVAALKLHFKLSTAFQQYFDYLCINR
jgi:hypothetical protein